MKSKLFVLISVLSFSLLFVPINTYAATYIDNIDSFTYNNYKIPKYDGDPYEEVNGNQPCFSEKELNQSIYEYYGNLDKFGRVTTCKANIDKSLMPTGKRGSIANVFPTGWMQNKYNFITGKWLFNRSHLIGWQLTGENANKRNLMTGTHFFNVKGMLPFENKVSKYLKKNKKNNVVYRVTPVFKKNNMLAYGVLMEAESVDDK